MTELLRTIRERKIITFLLLLTITFGLPRRVESTRINAAAEPRPGRWTHHVMIGTGEEIDDELLAWIREAAGFAGRKS